MTISITWTMILTIVSVYSVTRYLYFTYQKWTRGCYDIFDPTVSLTESMSDRGYREGYHQGLIEAKAKRRIKRMKKLKKSQASGTQDSNLGISSKNDLVIPL